MTSLVTTETTAAPTSARRTAGRALAATAVVVGLGLAVAGPAGAGLGDPVDPRDPTDETSTTSTTTTTTEAGGLGTPSTAGTTPATDAPTTTDAPEPTTTPAAVTEVDDDDDGTSAAALAAVGIVAFLVGLVVAAVPLGALLARRRSAAPSGPAVGTPPPPGPAAGAGPVIGPAPSRDADAVRQQRIALAQGLIALRDQIPSDALGTQAAEALAAAGIVELAPVGQPFDPAQHKAVDQVVTDDPAAHNTVVSVERPGYADGAQIIRQPQVVVARSGGGS